MATGFWLPPTGVFDRAGLLVTTILAGISLQEEDLGQTTFQGWLMSFHLYFHFDICEHLDSVQRRNSASFEFAAVEFVF